MEARVESPQRARAPVASPPVAPPPAGGISQRELLSDLKSISQRAGAVWRGCSPPSATPRDAEATSAQQRQLFSDAALASELRRMAAEALKAAREANEPHARATPEDETAQEDSPVTALSEIKAEREQIAQETIDLSLALDLLRTSLLSSAASCLAPDKQAEAWRLSAASTASSSVGTPAPEAAVGSPSHAAAVSHAAPKRTPLSLSPRSPPLDLSPAREGEEAAKRREDSLRSFWRRPAADARLVEAVQSEALQRSRPSAAQDLHDFWRRLLSLPPVCFRGEICDLFASPSLPHLIQDAKDAQRDVFLFNGSFCAGANGFVPLLKSLHDALRLAEAPRPSSFSSSLSSSSPFSLDSVLEALLLLHLQSRTYTGGCSADFLFPLLSLAPLCLLVPLPAQSMQNQLVALYEPALLEAGSSLASPAASLSPSACVSSSLRGEELPVGAQLHAHTQYRLHVSAEAGAVLRAAGERDAASSPSEACGRGESAARREARARGSSSRAQGEAPTLREPVAAAQCHTEVEDACSLRFENAAALASPPPEGAAVAELLERVVIDVHWFGWANLEALRRAAPLKRRMKNALRAQVTQSEKARGLWQEVAADFGVPASALSAADESGSELEEQRSEVQEEGGGFSAPEGGSAPQESASQAELSGARKETLFRQCVYLKTNARAVWEKFEKTRRAAESM
ncbi:hypothetical protein BESB_029910 [Besnoitia besnoiti]|uniref:Uncharacterized protein n=1 Tax=Besnoitia besnoiti TaxID=94643 RepID=A0A2A9M646_BESBE|nr:hypothetical protein BESB_029910 [Besnoitia besnoiti]PFH31117.1 hypothetical protein BESB_029910 [Besnoitia besnoiti]